jgi:uncharacterized membrane protein
VQELQKIIEKMEADHSERELKIKMLEEYIKDTLGAELPKEKTLKEKPKTVGVEGGQEAES